MAELVPDREASTLGPAVRRQENGTHRLVGVHDERCLEPVRGNFPDGDDVQRAADLFDGKVQRQVGLKLMDARGNVDR